MTPVSLAVAHSWAYEGWIPHKRVVNEPHRLLRLTAIVLSTLLCHAFGHPTKKQSTNLNIPLKRGFGSRTRCSISGASARGTASQPSRSFLE